MNNKFRRKKMKITVCVGSSCHLKGSYAVINGFKDIIAERHLEDKIELAASFCLGYCKDGVTIKVNDKIVTGLSQDNVMEVFQREVEPLL
ncbi:MAG: (2Fe-2S) ferredoxin domain-containing protein [Clostridia bacterium]